jgi:hypothetical protein
MDMTFLPVKLWQEMGVMMEERRRCCKTKAAIYTLPEKSHILAFLCLNGMRKMRELSSRSIAVNKTIYQKF